jgi:2-(1,2-epoxy-1,2-dihydrophenyl)acetyl-CoA isomerase
MPYETILTETRGQVRLVTLNRPDRLNAINAQLREDVHAAITEARDDDGVRAIVLTGAGRGFCSGADLMQVVRPPAAGGAPVELPTQAAKLDDMGWVGRWAKLFYECDKPIIAAINGAAAGAGMSAALACDCRVGSENARFKTAFVERNLSPDSGMSFFLPRIVGASRAADLVFTSRTVGAEEAYRMGLMDRLVAADALIDEAVALADAMAAQPPLAVRMAKRALQHNIEADLDSALRYETMALGMARRATNDAKESFAAFQEKRRGVFTGT